MCYNDIGVIPFKAVIVAKSQAKLIELRAEVRQVKTNMDHTVNVTLNLPEDCREQAKVLLDWQGQEIFAFVSNEPITTDNP